MGDFKVTNWLEEANEGLEKFGIPGLAVAAVVEGELVATEVLGVRDLDRQTPVTVDTLLAIGSATKAFTATLRALAHHMPEYLGLTLILAPFNIGLSLGASAFAYRALVPAGGRIDTAPAA